ncbi:beta-phosphoglucomutase [Paucilactobacillus oligofermentans DSM 15707 = LMG 22743]|uniref:Beta-phosphoglucomutase n=1 Tax=Paucilactobacillus oligofermentans DSM 15707 = LMG 22743 TaxID=1423778 RepID=A0A0R1RNF9_9LACO|nr:beta-phosphoglucomutase [Paucilactobacillus oligofermentans]KRL54856.1 beta-phosphoglucomutase [Paucilactobacillus oligofermentans DSM 15707 = LMG 22743]CUS26229.1 Beta-phosphoglucomutase [Paucilactobacillus oligofermentans DSM 15707 = LMG 22743]
MTKFSDIKGFAFDLDGVIADTARFHGQAWHQTADEVGTTWTEELAESLKGISRMDSLQLILDHGDHADSFSEKDKELLATKKNLNYQKLIETLTPEDILPGMLEFIRSADDNGYKMSIASASKNAPLILKQLGLTEYFVGIVDPATLHAGKPDPEIFVRAAEVLGLAPTAVIGLEDSSAGIDSINGAGQVSLGIGDDKVLSKATLNFKQTSLVTLENIKNKMTN